MTPLYAVADNIPTKHIPYSISTLFTPKFSVHSIYSKNPTPKYKKSLLKHPYIYDQNP